MTRTYDIKDHTGNRYGKLTAVRFERIGSSRNRLWLFRCDCGNVRTSVVGHVTAGKITSCGCEPNPIASRVAKLKQYYGFSTDEAAKWAIRADGTCDICGQRETVVQHGKVKPLAVDHCHISKRARGVLCSRCNIMLGYYEKHNAFPCSIECFDRYLNKFPWEP